MVEIRECWEGSSKGFYHQDYNIFGVVRGFVEKDTFFDYNFVKKLASSEYIGQQLLSSVYFLQYPVGGFARMHRDTGTTRTAITLIDDVDLVGGESIMQLEYKRVARAKGHLARRNNEETEFPPYGKKIRTKVLPIQKGETVIYGPDVKHGVAEVEQGSRLIMACWFKDPDNFTVRGM